MMPYRSAILAVLGTVAWAADERGVRLDAPHEMLSDGSASLAAIPLTDADEAGRADLVAAPVPFYNPALGAGLGGFVGYLFPWDRSDADSPPSVIGVGGFATDNGSWGAFAGHVGYADQDRLRWTLAAGYSELTYGYYPIGEGGDGSANSIDIDQDISFALIECLWQTAAKWYLGPRAIISRSEVGLHGGSGSNAEVIAEILDLDPVSKAVSPGVRLQYDSRDDTFSPGQGSLCDLVLMFSPEAFGSTTSYTVSKLTANQYRRLTPAQVLAVRFAAKHASDQAPFYVLPTAGSPEGLRGYIPGQYRDQVLVSFQAEWRWMMLRSLGVTGFAGIAAVGEDIGDTVDHPALPAAGVGLLWRLSQEFPVSMRLDAAWGRDSSTVYFSVGEAF